MNYDKQIALQLIDHAKLQNLLEFIEVVNESDHPYQASDELILSLPSSPPPTFKRIPILTTKDLKVNERRIYVSPMADEFPDSTRSDQATTLKIGISHYASLTPTEADPIEEEVERELELNQLYLEYLLFRRELPESYITAVARPQIFDWEMAHEKSLFRTIIVVDVMIT